MNTVIESSAGKSEIVILMPCAGDGRFFASALRSALEQTWTRICVVVVDNASATSIYREEIIKANDCRIKYIREDERLPIALNWQRCLKHAGSGLFCFLHDDDFWDQDYLRRVVAVFDANPYAEAVLTAHAELVDNSGKCSIGLSSLEWGRIVPCDKHGLVAALLLDDWGHMSAAMFRRCEFSFDLRSVWLVDQLYLSNYADSGKLVVNPDVLVGIRRHAGTVSAGTQRYIRVLERDQVLRRALHIYRDNADFTDSVARFASQSGEMAFRLFRGVCSWPLNISVVRMYKGVLISQPFLRSLETRFHFAGPARFLGIYWLIFLSLAIDCVYLLKTYSRRG
jgi:glycosyltransferase involved in cell wall biosynthesis